MRLLLFLLGAYLFYVSKTRFDHFAHAIHISAAQYGNAILRLSEITRPLSRADRRH